MYAYPSILPTEEIRHFLPILRGELPEGPKAVQAGWVIVGYGLSQAVPPGPAPMGAIEDPDARDRLPSPQECADHLEQAVAMRTPDGQAPAAIPWQVIVPVVLELIVTWWRNRQPRA